MSICDFEQIEYTLPDFWACALINGDYSGMSDKDAEALSYWLDDTAEERGVGGHWGIPSDESKGFTGSHDADRYVLACDCLDYVWNKRV